MKDEGIEMAALRTVETRRILLVANETIEGAALREVIARRNASEPPAEVLVIAPALNSRMRHWLSDVDDARRAAGLRLAASLEHLSAAGIEAEGMVGDADPLQAIADALHLFEAEEIAIATAPPERAHWLTRDLVRRARERFCERVVALVVDSDDGSNARSRSLIKGRHAWSAKSSAALHARTHKRADERTGPAAERNGRGSSRPARDEDLRLDGPLAQRSPNSTRKGSS